MRKLAPVAAIAIMALAAGPTAVSLGSAPARIPLTDAVATMEPAAVWQAFADLTRIPRPSHHEDAAAQYVADVGTRLGLETIVDPVGNVLIRKPASPGMEDRHGVVLQAHLDMVPQAIEGKAFDFTTQPIDAFVDGDWVVADGTTLGADDGIGVALALGVLQSDVAMGPIEALFTRNEEDGMDGALGLPAGELQGDILINLDSEQEGQFTIGSAGGEVAAGTATVAMVAPPVGSVAYTVTVGGLQGGHSGVDIALGRGHATKLLVRVLGGLAADMDLGLASLTGGTADNAIPRSATAVVVVPEAAAADLEAAVVAWEQVLVNELALADPDVMARAEPADLPTMMLTTADRDRVLDVLAATPQGVLRMSDTVPGLVETSTNMGIVTLADGRLDITGMMRSSVDSELDAVHALTAATWRLGGVDTTFSGRYGGWAPDPGSPILALMQDAYRGLRGADPTVIAIHAGLEAGTIRTIEPGMDAISVGPTVENVHTPDERLRIETVGQLYDLVMATLAAIPAR